MCVKKRKMVIGFVVTKQKTRPAFAGASIRVEQIQCHHRHHHHYDHQIDNDPIIARCIG